MANPKSLQNLFIQELLDKFPETIPVFMRHQMACVGCDINALETVSEAITIYRLDSEQFLSELDQAIQAKRKESL